jgi:hypothetical protein
LILFWIRRILISIDPNENEKKHTSVKAIMYSVDGKKKKNMHGRSKARNRLTTPNTEVSRDKERSMELALRIAKTQPTLLLYLLGLFM